MGKRVLGIAIIVPIGVSLVLAGGWIFTIGVAVILSIASWEFWSLFQGSKYNPSKIFLIFTAVLSCVFRYAFGGEYFELVFMIFFVSGVIINLVRYEKEDTYHVATLGFEILGMIFISYLGSFLVSLRFLPDGKMWILLAIPAIGSGDIGAFLLGSSLGKHKMAPKVSPKKSIEGYIGGILFTVLYAVLFTLVFTYGTANITIQRASFLGLILGIVSPLGDLLESLFKRAFNRKDSGKLIPGHGGILDRIDTWLIGGAAAYYLITLLWV